MIFMTVLKAIDVRRKAADSFWKRAEAMYEKVNKGDRTKEMKLNFSVLNWYTYFGKLLFSQKTDDRLFAAEQTVKFLEEQGRLHGNYISRGAEVQLLAEDPDVIVRAAFVRGLCTPRNISEFGNNLIALAIMSREKIILEALKEGAAKTAKNDAAPKEAREKAVMILINVMGNSSRLKYLDIQDAAAKDLIELRGIFVNAPVKETLDTIDQSLRKTIENIKEGRVIMPQIVLAVAMLVEACKQNRVNEAVNALTGLWQNPLLPVELRKQIRDTLMVLGVRVPFAAEIEFDSDRN